MGRNRKRTRSPSSERVRKKDLLKRINNLEKQLTKRRRDVSRERSRSRSESYDPRRAPRRSRGNSGSDSDRSHNSWRSRYRSPSVRTNRSHTTDRIPRDSAVRGNVERHLQVPADVAVTHTDDEQAERTRHNVSVTQSPERTPPLILNNDIQLEDNILEILGEDPQKCSNKVFRLHEAVCSRWEHIISHGLSEENKKLLLEKYGIPENFTGLKAPELNPEILSAITALHKKKDSYYCELQEDLGRGLATLGSSLNLLLEEQLNIPNSTKEKILGSLWDSSRFFSDIFYKLTKNRRSLIAQNLNRPIKEVLEKTVPGNFLFGPDLGEKIKSARIIEKTGKDLMSQPAYKPMNKGSYTQYPPLAGKGGGRDIVHRKPRSENRQRPVRAKRDTKPPGRAYYRPSKTEYARRRN